MNDENQNANDVAAQDMTTRPVAEDAATPGTPAEEVQNGKAFAVLSYALSFIGLPFFVIPLITRDNDYALFHAKQSLILWLAGIVVSVVSVPLSVICIGVITGIVGGIALLVFNIMGLVNAVKGEMKPLPFIGPWGVEWFKGITKVAK